MWINITAPLIVLFVCVAITCIIAYYIIQPFDSVVRRVRKGGEKPSDAEKKCLAAYRKIAVLLFASNCRLFLGQIIVVLLRKSPNPVFSSMIHIIVTIVYSVSAGSMAAGIEIWFK